MLYYIYISNPICNTAIVIPNNSLIKLINLLFIYLSVFAMDVMVLPMVLVLQYILMVMMS